MTHVKIIDGTGAPAQSERTIIIENNRIASITPADAPIPANTTILDLSGHTVLPGLVGMHDHMFYTALPNLDADGRSEAPRVLPQMTFSAPRLYLAAGVTTLRTTGSVEPFSDLNLKHMIDEGVLPGPHMDVTGPYLEGPHSPFIQMYQLRNADDARRFVAYWADVGATSFKAYMNITRAELKAAIDEAHRRGLKVTGHLCSVTYPEAIELGIDNLEHGFFVNSQLAPDKRPDICPASGRAVHPMEPDSPEATALIALLVRKHVALTSTLPVFEQGVAGHAPLQTRVMAAMSPPALQAYLYARNQLHAASQERIAVASAGLQREMILERKFLDAGWILLAGPDPTGNGGVLPGFGDQREVELLVEAGLTPEQAIRIASYNGAAFLGVQDRIGTVSVGKAADLVIVNGDPSQKISDIENVQIVFKDGTGVRF